MLTLSIDVVCSSGELQRFLGARCLWDTRCGSRNHRLAIMRKDGRERQYKGFSLSLSFSVSLRLSLSHSLSRWLSFSVSLALPRAASLSVSLSLSPSLSLARSLLFALHVYVHVWIYARCGATASFSAKSVVCLAATTLKSLAILTHTLAGCAALSLAKTGLVMATGRAALSKADSNRFHGRGARVCSQLAV